MPINGKRYPEEFKIEAVKQVVDRGHSVSSNRNTNGLRKESTERETKPEAIYLIISKCFIKVSVDMVRASRYHRLNMKTYIINGSGVSRLSVAIQHIFNLKLYFTHYIILFNLKIKTYKKRF